MVSFLGIKFGSDKKKAQNKRDIRSNPWTQQEQISSEEADFIEHSFPVPPNQPLARPSTSYSSHGGMTFRPPYAGNTAASSSMVDLAPPSARRPSVGSLRHHASETTLRGPGSRPNISGPIGPPRPLALDMRPSSSGGGRKKEWINPLDIHFGKNSFGSRPGTPRDGAPPPRTTLPPADPMQMDARSSHSTDIRPDDTVGGANGYPSPPPSVKNSDGRLSPATSEHRVAPGSRPAAPSSLRRVNTAEMTQEGPGPALNTLRRVNTAHPTAGELPSPAVSEEPWEGPVIRNVQAKRDTMTFHSPRRRSFVKHVDQGVVKREQVARTEEERLEIKKRRQTEGFEGNFSAFDFGGGSQPPPIDTQVPLPTAPSKASPRPSLDQPESPIDGRRPFQMVDDKRTARQRGMSEAMTIESIEREEREVAEQNALQSPYRTPSEDRTRPPTWESRHTGNPSETSSVRHGHGAPSYDSMSSRPLRPRVDSDTRSPGTPTNLYASPSAADQMQFRSRSPRRSPSPEYGNEVPPPRLNPDRRSQSPLARTPIEGNFPVVRGLPRGRRPGPPPPIAIMPQEQHERDGDADPNGWTDRMDKHRSAIPPPLSPARPARHGNEDISPWVSTPVSPAMAPRLPSPTFPSLEKTISSSSEDLAKSFELAARAASSPFDRPLISPVASEFSIGGPGRRVEATRAPPRPAPVTLPPSIGKDGRSTTPTSGMSSPRRVTAGFI